MRGILKKLIAAVAATAQLCVLTPAYASGLVGINVKFLSSETKIYYIDSENGSDDNSGLSEGKAWKTLDKVNSTTFEAGDSVLFKADTVYNGQLWPKGSGRQGSEITLGMYGGGGRPVINGGGIQQPAVMLNNQEYWVIENLEVTNDDDFETDQEELGGVAGIMVWGEDKGELHGITIRDCYVHDVDSKHIKDGVAALGVRVRGTSVPTWFNGVTIENNFIEDCDRSGLSVGSSWVNPQRTVWKISENVAVRNNIVKDVAGDGIVVTSSNKPILEYNTSIHNCTKTLAANAAIWVYATEGAVMQFNESYDTVPGGTDKQGFDIDHATTNTTLQYNYSHNNGGGFLLICCPENGINGGNTVRYNISQNDRTDIFRINGFIGPTDVEGGRAPTIIYNNTFYVDKSIKTRDISFYNWGGIGGDLRFYNNIFANEGEGEALFCQENLTEKPSYENNLWQCEKESMPKDSKKIIADPKFVLKGSGRAGINTVDGYKLSADSPCIDKGKVIENNGKRDYFGNKLYNNLPDLGAAEYYAEEDKTPADIEESPYKDAIKLMNFLNIYKADKDKKFKPDEKITGDEIIKALVRAAGLETFAKAYTYGNYFEADKKETGFADTARDFGILDKSVTYEDLSNPISLDKALSWILNLALGDSGTEKKTDVLAQAKEMGLLEGIDGLGGDTELTRGITAQLLYNLVESEKEYYNLNKKGLKFFDKKRTVCSTFNPGPGTVLQAADQGYTKSGKFAKTNCKDEIGDFLIGRSALATPQGDDWHRNGYLKFDLKLLKSVSKATLRLYSDTLYSTTKFGTISVYEIQNDNWAIDSITWDNAPKVKKLIAKSELVSEPKKYYDIDITNIVKQEFNGDKILSLMITGTDNDDVVLYIGSTGFSNYPQLVVQE